jgi:hypothetical protein
MPNYLDQDVIPGGNFAERWDNPHHAIVWYFKFTNALMLFTAGQRLAESQETSFLELGCHWSIWLLIKDNSAV